MAERGAQAPRCCQFCDTNNKVQWKCYDCLLILCEHCKVKLHSKVTFDKVHTILNIRDPEPSENEELKSNKFRRILCSVHLHQSCCMFCVSCDQLICSYCLLDFHKDHALEDIQKSFERKRTELENIQQNINDQLLASVQKDRRAIDELWSKELYHYDKTKLNIKSKMGNITKCIEAYGTRLLEQIEAINKRSYDSLEMENKRLDQREQRLVDKRNGIETALHSIRPADILQIKPETMVDESEVIQSSVAPSRSMVEFVEGPFNIDKIEQQQNIFGSLLEICVLQSYYTDFPDVGIVAAFDDMIWIANKERKVLQKIKPGKELDIVTSIENIEVSDCSVTPTGDLILKLSKSNKLTILSKDGKQSVLRDFSPLKPTCVHVTALGDIIVGVKDVGQNFAVSDSSKRQLVVLTPGRKLKSTFEYDSTKTRLFTYVWHLTSTNCGEICVIDRLADDFKGRIVKLNQEGQVKWIFNGNYDIILKNDAFKPRDLVAITNGNIIVSERQTHTLYILSDVDGLIVRVLADGIDVYLPQALCLDNKGNLWIGCSAYRNKHESAKLHMIHLNFLK